jgi:hypothetical protein
MTIEFAVSGEWADTTGPPPDQILVLFTPRIPRGTVIDVAGVGEVIATVPAVIVAGVLTDGTGSTGVTLPANDAALNLPQLVYDVSFDSPLVGNFACDGPLVSGNLGEPNAIISRGCVGVR